MYAKINEKYFQPTFLRNDIFRKFEMQFSECFLNSINIDNSLYIEQPTEEYKISFDAFINNNSSDIKFFIGYTGVGKTTFLKNYFGYRTIGPKKYREDAMIIPCSWDGRKISDEKYKDEINEQIRNIITSLIRSLLKELTKEYESLLLEESEEIMQFIIDTRCDIVSTLSIGEIVELNQSSIKLTNTQAILQKSQKEFPIEFASSLLKYVIEKYRSNIKRLIFIIDDLETLAQHKICYLITIYLRIYDCMHNSKNKIAVKLLISLRPHSFRFLRNNIDHKHVNAYGNFLDDSTRIILKNQIPDVRGILRVKFQDAFSRTEKPGNPQTWSKAKEVFFNIIDNFDVSTIKTVSQICHLNIRAVIDCFHMILCNRVWCQEYNEYNDYPDVKFEDYKFDIVNVIRTLACGESPVYTGAKNIQFNQRNVSNVLSRPCFDDSDIFIPNILIDIETGMCDILPAMIIKYLDNYFDSKVSSLPNTEYMKRSELCNNINKVLGKYVKKEKINNIIDYLFNNRIIRKSIISQDTDNTINKLLDEDYIYLTLKGSAFLSMFTKDSILLEIYREDIKREYNRPNLTYKSSFELRTENNQGLLFEDLINLVREIFNSEDKYQTYVKGNAEKLLFYELNFPISTGLLFGIERSLNRSSYVDLETKNVLGRKINKLKKEINQRLHEMQTYKT